MLNRLFATGLVMAVLAMPLAAFAQRGNPTHIPNHPRVNQVNQRLQNQHQRIIQGDKSGQLSGREQRQLHRQYWNIKHEERRMRSADNGHLTKQDQRILNRQESRRSREIYRYKHN